MRTLHPGLYVADLDASLAFSTPLDYSVVGRVRARRSATWCC
jgi:hypothetical protein